MSSIPKTDAKNLPARYGVVFDGDFKPVIMDFQTGKFYGMPSDLQAYRWSNMLNLDMTLGILNSGRNKSYTDSAFWHPLNKPKPEPESVSHWGLLSNLVPNYK